MKTNLKIKIANKKKTPAKVAASVEAKLVGLQTNWLDVTFGVEAPPVFGWRLEDSKIGAAQRSYRIVVAKNNSMKNPVWDSGVVKSPLSAAIQYEGKPLESATRYWWSVEVVNQDGKTIKSDTTWFDTGLIDKTLWNGSEWIMAKPLPDGEENKHPAMALRKIVKNKKAIRSAKWFVSGLGVFEAYINGERVSNLGINGETLLDELKPGFTDARKLRQYFTYDVTHLVNTAAGAKNILAAVVTKGWWSDQITGKIGKREAFRGQMLVTYTDGSKDFIGTDKTWSAAFDGAVVTAEIHYGEDYDARIDQSWLTGGKLGEGWGKAVINDEFKGRIEALQGPSVRLRDDLELKPAEISVIAAKKFDAVTDDCYGKAITLRTYTDGEAITLKPGEILLVDFAQNNVGRERIVLKGFEGTKIEVRHSEFLNDHEGQHDRGNDGPGGTPYYKNLRAARAAMHYTVAGKETETLRSLFSFYGYRYIAVTTTKKIEIESIASEVINSVPFGADTGYLETTNPLVNRLIKNCRWGHYSNYLSVPTDCPQRNERLGWTADTQVFSGAAAYDGVSYGFLQKFMRDMRDGQGPEGGFPGVAPYAQYGNNRVKVGWGDAAIIVPYKMWKAYGDTTIIRENYEGMFRYMILLEQINGPVPCWGDWLAYERNDGDIQRYLGCAYYVWDAMLMSEMAAAIGDEEGVARFKDMEKWGRAVFRDDYLNKDGTIKERYRCQTAYLFAIMLNLNTSEEGRKAAISDLLENIRNHGDRLQTGFLGTAIIMNTLSGIGATDVAYKLLLQENEPSWLYSVLQGATTMWERWNSYTKEKGFGNASMNSFNHYAYGAVLEWMFGTMAGIRYDSAAPGYRHFILAPEPDPSIEGVKSSYRTPYGTVKSEWRYNGKAWHLEAAVPANTTAAIAIPVPKGKRVLVNGKKPETLAYSTDGLVFRGKENGKYHFDAVACSFTISVK